MNYLKKHFRNICIRSLFVLNLVSFLFMGCIIDLWKWWIFAIMLLNLAMIAWIAYANGGEVF